MVDYKSSPQVLEHLQKSLAWTVFDTKWIPGTSSFVAVGAYARGKRERREREERRRAPREKASRPPDRKRRPLLTRD